MSSGAALISDSQKPAILNLLDLMKFRRRELLMFLVPESWGPTHNSAISRSASSSIEVAQDNECVPWRTLNVEEAPSGSESTLDTKPGEAEVCEGAQESEEAARSEEASAT
ncbi:hypothetical protein GWK47_009479 [Chionoecetes opilio]|uniref:Uncharacterized protein n=1 Tax=Chionoecetes opilio TaxID=41210 RepID=A0A8J4Y3F3_CHIOP|nr:hypothetical protein GWK47_009479 [Chionoecetes opilio]